MENQVHSANPPLEVASSILSVFSFEGVDGEVVVAFLLTLIVSVALFVKLFDYLKNCLQASWRERNENLILQPPQPSFNRSEEPCPICYGSITLAVETDCYHLFCGSCMMGLIQHARHRNVTCPVCRAQVSMLYPVFTEDEYSSRNANLERSRNDLTSEIQEYNRLFSGGRRSLLQTIFELPVFVRRLWRSFNNPNDVFVQHRMKTLLYIILFLVAAYILFPFDLFPEVHFGFLGLLDDVLVLVISLLYLTNVYRSLYFNLEQ